MPDNNIYPENSIILAPLSGYTDLPYRRSVRRHGCKYAFTEMIDASSIVYKNLRTGDMMFRGNDEPWLGVQLVGSNHERIAKAVKILNEHNFDVLDFNLGCPVPKVAKKNAGAALGLDPAKAAAAFAIIARHSRFPVTAKIRILDEHDPAPTIELVKRLEDAGAQAVTIHGRIKKSFYSGPVFFDIIAAVREACGIQIIANGGIMKYDDFAEMKKLTGCSCVMLARGAMGNPWLFNQLEQGKNFRPPTPHQLADELEQQVLEMIEYYNEELAMKLARKIILDYLKGRGYCSTLRREVSFLCTRGNFAEFMLKVRQGPSERYWNQLKSLEPSGRELLHP